MQFTLTFDSPEEAMAHLAVMAGRAEVQPPTKVALANHLEAHVQLRSLPDGDGGIVLELWPARHFDSAGEAVKSLAKGETLPLL